MAEEKQTIIESWYLRERLQLLQEAYRATLNILEDFDAEKEKFKLVQQATINLLEDFDAEREKFRLIQTATLNLLEDMNEERNKLDAARSALTNILEDVETERVNAEEARVSLESVNKELEAFSYSVSHDLRAPLRAISGFSEAVMEDYVSKLDDEGKRYLGLIKENAQKMGQLVDDLLAFSRLSRQEMIKTQINIVELAKNIFADLLAQAPQRKINFTISSCPPVYGDTSTIKQVLINLLSNSIKFTRIRPEARIEVGYLTGPNAGAYYVKDNGVGFDMQYANKLFGVFQRLHSITEFEGTGIGLALVYRIISRHAGRVWAEGKVNEGATFYFTLPQVR